MDAWKTSLKERLERRHATLEAIAATTSELRFSQPGSYQDLSYAENQATQHTILQARQEFNVIQKDDSQSLEGGWTLVSRKRIHRSIKTQPKKVHPELKKHKQVLMEDNRCFKCLSEGGKQSACRDVIRCLKCKAYGHIAGRCKATKLAIKRPPVLNKDEGKIEEQNHPKQQTNMDIRNTEWETMELLPPSLVEGRPGTMRVYLPPREHYASYGVLDYSAVVMAGPHRADPYLAQRISTALAGHYDLHPRDFRVTAPDNTIGDLLVEFPYNDTCREVVHEGFFILTNDTEVQIDRWTLALGMVRHSMPYRARVKLYDVPAGVQQEQERHQSPNCRHWDLLMTTDPHARLVRVQLEGLIIIETEIMTPRPPERYLPPPAPWRSRESNEEDYEPRPEIGGTGNTEGKGEMTIMLMIAASIPTAETPSWFILGLKEQVNTQSLLSRDMAYGAQSETGPKYGIGSTKSFIGPSKAAIRDWEPLTGHTEAQLELDSAEASIGPPRKAQQEDVKKGFTDRRKATQTQLTTRAKNTRPHPITKNEMLLQKGKARRCWRGHRQVLRTRHMAQGAAATKSGHDKVQCTYLPWTGHASPKVMQRRQQI
ncbi:hypothetical protein FCM35_KLT21813 [Carex littledalei]|uniref:CCHC-type domain-containing protein n=1 Tax=Carex littledalei TaxID=544730 RepID=A0A833QG90_9POAL|nr:hypothetical protein FCM35_KLT21813 [Carex littledalei]